ncbi:MAG TPA: hypothetical protein VFM58_22015 [Solirubrobacteraceae bacterium]|jgi:hypothetical protein|nr:hypothetical protein [Solirubrobacteraceae bacterium]
MRSTITIVALIFVCAFGFMTVYVLLRSGPDLLTGLSLIVVALMAFGILGALTEPPDKRR